MNPKIYLLIILVCFTAYGALAQKAVKVPQEVLKLKEAAFDFGKIPQGRPVTHNFEVINNGKKPLLIEHVEASCGCTSPEWSQAPIQPGTSTFIKVGFNAAAEGPFNKTITINYNGNQVKTLIITGEVYPTPTTSAPINTSLSLIKQINQ
jgi:hypothetical protein